MLAAGVVGVLGLTLAGPASAAKPGKPAHEIALVRHAHPAKTHHVQAHAFKAHAGKAHAGKAHAGKAHAGKAHAVKAHAVKAHAVKAHPAKTHAAKAQGRQSSTKSTSSVRRAESIASSKTAHRAGKAARPNGHPSHKKSPPAKKAKSVKPQARHLSGGKQSSAHSARTAHSTHTAARRFAGAPSALSPGSATSLLDTSSNAGAAAHAHHHKVTAGRARAPRQHRVTTGPSTPPDAVKAPIPGIGEQIFKITGSRLISDAAAWTFGILLLIALAMIVASVVTGRQRSNRPTSG